MRLSRGPLERASFNRLSYSRLLTAEASERLDNPAWGDASIRVLVLRLSPWQDLDRAVGHFFLAAQARLCLERAYVDFGFFPSFRDRQILDQLGAPWLLGLESRRGLAEFDIALVSNATTLEMLNLAPALSGSGLAPRHLERRSEEGPLPLILLGGSNALAAQALMGNPMGRPDRADDALPDAIFFGEGEDELPAVLRAALSVAHEAHGYTAAQALNALRAMAEASEALWVPGCRARRRRALARGSLIQDPLELSMQSLLNNGQSSTLKFMVSRGCASHCRFCLEGCERKPYREAPAQELLGIAAKARTLGGSQEVELDSFNFNARSDFPQLALGLALSFPRLGLMSQRADILQADPRLADFEVALDKRSFTLGVEGISERLRLFYNKGVSGDCLERLCRSLLGKRVKELKLFYMISGYEEDGDLEEFSRFVKYLKHERNAAASPSRVLFSASFFVRMPFTPLRHDTPCLDEARLRRLAGRLKSACDTNGFEFRLSSFMDEYLLSQLLVGGGEGLFELLLALAKAPYLYDKQLSRGAYQCAKEELGRLGFDWERLLAPKGADWVFPLPFLDAGIAPSHLWDSYQEALSRLERPPGSPPVSQPDSRPTRRPGPGSTSCQGGVCLGCGACQGNEAQGLARLMPQPVQEGQLREAKSLQAAKRAPKHLYILSILPPSLCGAGSPYRSAYLGRLLFPLLSLGGRGILGIDDARPEAVAPGEGARGLLSEGLEQLNFHGLWCFRLSYLDDGNLGRELAERAVGLRGFSGFLPKPPDGALLAMALSIEDAPPAPGFASWAPALDEALQDYLLGAEIAFVRLRQEGDYVFEIPKPAQKKRVLGWARVRASGELRLDALRKFDFSRFKDCLAKAGAPPESLRIEILDIDGILAAGRD